MNPVSNGFLLSLSLCMDIGVVNIAMITLALQRGFWNGFWLGLGSCVGDLVYALLALGGMVLLLRFEPVRWVMWVGGSLVMLWFTWRMFQAARHAARLQLADTQGAPRDHGRQFLRGLLLAMSSPSAIIWFAVVGGALIAKSGAAGDWRVTALFLSGFFTAGLVWTVGLCLLANRGGSLLGDRLLQFSYAASALLFAWFSWQVITSGYQSLIVAPPGA